MALCPFCRRYPQRPRTPHMRVGQSQSHAIFLRVDRAGAFSIVNFRGAERHRVARRHFRNSLPMLRQHQLYASTAIAVVLAAYAAPHAASAQDATWAGATADFNTAANWTPATVPTGTAFFGASGPAALSFSANTNFGGWTFNADAQAYTISNSGWQLSFTGAGIMVNGGSADIANAGNLMFSNSSSAGTATITNGGGLMFVDNSTAGSATITNNSLLYFQNASTAGNSTVTVSNGSLALFQNTSTAGNATITTAKSGTIEFTDSSTAGSATITNNGILYFENASTAGSANITTNIGVTQFKGTSTAGSATITTDANSVMDFFFNSTAGNSTINNAGGMSFSNNATAGSATITNTGGVIFYGQSSADSATIINNFEMSFNNLSTAANATITNNHSLKFLDNSTAGNAAIINNAGGTVDFSLTSGLTGNNIITAGSIAGAGNYNLGANILTVGGNNSSTEVSGVISGKSLYKDGTGTLTLSGANTYTGPTGVFGGTLMVNGSIASSSAIGVANGATLSGTGTLSDTVVGTGGVFAPGNGTPGSSITVQGGLEFVTGGRYLVQVNPSTASFANVIGTANLDNGTAVANFADGAYVQKQYTILKAGSIVGTFSELTSNAPAGAVSLSYDLTHAYLDVVLGFANTPVYTTLNQNQRNVADALNNYFNATGGIPGEFFSLSPQGLSQVSGELATGAQQATFDAMNMFMGAMTDPFVAGRSGNSTSTGASASSYTDENMSGNAPMAYAARGARSPNDAYAAIYTKAQPPVASFEQRWSTWSAGYGGSQTTTGNGATGSNTATSSIYGGAVGADYHLSPDTLMGFALAGGGTNFSVAGSGSGRSDLFQAGAFLRHETGPAYLSAAFAYGWQNITTDRTVTAAGVDRLRASFDANAFSGRVESGYRFISPIFGGVGLTPYAAGQVTLFDLPSYGEQAVSGANTFALSYAAKDATATRSELGLRTDKSFAMNDAILTLRGRAAWAHNFDPDHAIGATFQTLPGASFVVNGAAQAGDSALISASAETKWLNGWSVAGTFEGEFSSVTNSYAGKGVVRYAW